MTQEIQVFGPNARLMVTYDGVQGDYPDMIHVDSTDADVRRIAAEAIQTGYIPGINADRNANLANFVVDRFPATDTLPARLIVRPKTPFGSDGKYYGTIFRNKDDSLVPPDQWLLFLAKDNAVPATLQKYREECVRLGSSEEHLRGVDRLIGNVLEWRLGHPDLCKVPD